MAWTYDTALTLTRDKVRLLIGDTDTNDQQLQDAEITWLATRAPNAEAIAALAAETLAAKYARAVQKGVGSFNLAAQQKWEHYKELAVQLRAGLGLLYAIPTAGGISFDAKDTLTEDDDRPPTYFKVGMQEHPGAKDASITGESTDKELP